MTRIRRRTFLCQSAATAALALAVRPLRAKSANEKLNLGFIGTGGRGNELRVDVVFAHDRSRLNAEVQVGHQSTGWCNLANVALEAAAANSAASYRREAAEAVAQSVAPWGTLISMMEQHLSKNSADVKARFCVSPVFQFDPKSEQFVGNESQRANQFLRREYRSQFEVPAVS